MKRYKRVPLDKVERLERQYAWPPIAAGTPKQVTSCRQIRACLYAELTRRVAPLPDIDEVTTARYPGTLFDLWRRYHPGNHRHQNRKRRGGWRDAGPVTIRKDGKWVVRGVGHPRGGPA